MMRTNHRYLLLALVVLSALSAAAQTRLYGDWGSNYKKPKFKVNNAGLYTDQYDGVHHLVGIQVDGAYSTFFHAREVATNAPGGYSVGAAFQYAYVNGTFLVQTGVGVRFQDVKNRVFDQKYMRESFDVVGAVNQMTYDFTQRTDEMRELYVQVPLFVGGYIRGFYLLGGPKLSIPVWGNTKLDLLTTSTATYKGYIGTMQEMDNHGIRREVPLTPDQRNREALKLRLDLMGVFEFGYELAFSNKGGQTYHRTNMVDQRLRIGAFAEIGILNVAPRTEQPLNEVPETAPYDFQDFQYNHVYSTGMISSLHNFYAGLRLTYIFSGIQTSEKCLLCGSRGLVSPW